MGNGVLLTVCTIQVQSGSWVVGRGSWVIVRVKKVAS